MAVWDSWQMDLEGPVKAPIRARDLRYNTSDRYFISLRQIINTSNAQRQYFYNLGCIKNGAGAPKPIPSGNSVGQQAVIFRPGHPEFVAGAGYVIPGQYSSELYLASLSTK